jgi:bifunctional DNA primase/polymerase-like protein
MPTPLSAALKLAATGFWCFPVAASKSPTTRRGLLDATTDPAVLRDLWAQHPGPLIGVATGVTSGIDVLDIDQKPTARAWWRENRDRIPATRTHRTRSGGLHLLFRHASGQRCSVGRIARGIDTRSDGGYCIWWPAAGMPVLCDASPAPWPSWLLDLLKPAPPPPRRAVIPDDLQIRRILNCVAIAQPGERNSVTFWAACRFGEMTATGLLSEDDALALIVDAATTTGLSHREALAAARSGLKRGR